MYPNSIYFGLKVVPIKVLEGQSIYYLGTWTLRVIRILVEPPALKADVTSTQPTSMATMPLAKGACFHQVSCCIVSVSAVLVDRGIAGVAVLLHLGGSTV